MRAIPHTIFAVLLSLCMPVMAEGLVMDDSENFALLEEQAQAAEELPVAQEEPYPIANELEDSTVHHAANSRSGTTSRNIALVNKLQSIQKEVQELRGQLEVQAHEIEELKQQQLAYYQDLDNRLNQSPLGQIAQESHAIAPIQQNHKQHVASEPTTLSVNDKIITPQTAIDIQPTQDLVLTPTNNARINPADEQISYLAAYDLVKQKQFPQATQAMQQFLTNYPRGGYSANAHYWLGELHLAHKDYSEAITQFDTIVQNFKSSSKYAPSRLKLGYALAETGRIGEAKEQLTAVMNQYPDTSAARLAHTKLEKLGG